MQIRYQSLYVLVLSAVISVAATGKLHYAASAISTLDTLEQVSGLTVRQLMVYSGGLEVVTATLLASPVGVGFKIHLSACFACGILAFRVVKAMVGDVSGCHCLGSIGNLLGMSDSITKWLSYALAFGILGFWLWVQVAEMIAAKARLNHVL